MSQDVVKQFDKLLNNSSHVLILLPESPKHDLFCCALALTHFCETKNITTTIAYSDPFEETASLNFLPRAKNSSIIHSISGSRDLILSFNTKYNKILNVQTEPGDDILNIRITPEHGMVDSRDFSFLPGKFPYDIIITIGAIEKESMGKIYDDMPDIFYEIPIINIDNKSANEQYGQVNIVNAVASSVSEMIGDIFERLHIAKIPKLCAQCLLAGIISETNSFQNHNTTPHALTLASRLIEFGADQQIIIHNLYRNQTFSLLQLWGRTMKNLTTLPCHKQIVISTITLQDRMQTKAEKHQLHAILKKMKQNYPSGKIFLLVYENDDHTFCALIDTKNANIALEETLDNITVLEGYNYELPFTAHSTEEIHTAMCDLLMPYISLLN
jgi:nanoRNase/pAp phosphatase (c-di-AMP/oligoRNAs hydrolase)